MTIIIHPCTFLDDCPMSLCTAAKTLFTAYATELRDEHGCDLSFQSFQAELDGLPGPFSFSAGGGLWVATYSDDGEDDVVSPSPGSVLPGGREPRPEDCVGCIALKVIGDGVAEVKRMYVSKGHRSKGIGRALLRLTVKRAMAESYTVVKLDSLERLEGAVRLYEREGFKRCGKSWKPGWEGAAASISYYRLGLK
mmetsp:Transcript_7347/g.15263  ORF Transcript_7347/g.15263 Transcript_7347/m.15263 type:complete len:195 (+) Transcript_7347:161-745(+)